MKIHRLFGTLAVLISLILPVRAATFYVAQNNLNPALPYSGWNTAATNIQDAINAASNGDDILVTNGVYQSGGLAMVGTLTNRVALNKAVTVQSVNGPWVTIIQGAGATNGPNAVRCAWLTNNAALKGFTLQAGATSTSGDIYGGGVWCASSNAMVANCVVVSNTAFSYGGGAWQGTLENSLLSKNSTQTAQGGGGANSVMINCTVFSNANYGVYAGYYTNCIVYSNAPADHASGGTFAYSCTTQLGAGGGNITAAAQLLADGVHLQNGSPCIGAGTNVATGTDIFGNAWGNPPSMGCAEWTAAPVVTQPLIQLSGTPPGFTLGNAGVAGAPPFSYYWLQNGVPLQNNGEFNGVQTTNLTVAGVILADASGFQLVVSNAFGMTTSAVVSLVVHCVAAGSANPVAPYTNWATAATNIQSAITSAAAGDVVLVTNGVYATGGISMDGVIVNCVSVNKALLVQSVNGPAATIIQGTLDPTATNGPGAVRCAWLGTNAVLAGFTLQGGATRSGATSPATEGGGIYCSQTNVVVYNCVIATNYAANEGGGVFANIALGKPSYTTLINCTLTGNQSGLGDNAGTGGTGGGAAGCNLRNCLITSNSAQSGGGTYNCHATNCAYVLNTITTSVYAEGYYGGAVDGGTLVNCTVSKNLTSYSGFSGGAVYEATLFNSIVYGNFSPGSSAPNYVSCTMTNCDSSPLPTGAGNIALNPQLLTDGIHLAPTSPCIGAGLESVVSGTDIDGQPWNNPPAIGCDEWYPTPLIVIQPAVQVDSPAFGLTVSTAVAGQTPSCFWTVNGSAIQDSGHYVNSGTANLTVNNFGPGDAGIYQVVVSNAVGVITSQVAQVVIHVVNAAGMNPEGPYSSWATAATNIQDAINVAATGDIVLVTNGVYAFGGMVMAGNLTSRVALNRPVFVTSANGYAVTAIDGAVDPVSLAAGPNAVRCAYVGDGATLYGFTLQNGATAATGDGNNQGGPLESGGGAYCNSAAGVVANCVLSNNYAIYGAGFNNGTLNNSLVIDNQSVSYGGGAFDAIFNNCTVVYNSAGNSMAAGVYTGAFQNCIIVDNYNFAQPPSSYENYASLGAAFFNSCSSPVPVGGGNINVNPQFLDEYHLAAASACRGTGSAAYASGTDLDGQPWGSPPSMGCSEVVVANLFGPLSATIYSYQTNVLVNHFGTFQGGFGGHASADGFSFGDGQVVTNSGLNAAHAWKQPGNYTVAFMVYNNDYPDGVSASTVIQVLPILAPQLQLSEVLTNGFEFQFLGQTNAMYTIQYATNLVPPVTWNTIQYIFDGSSGWNQAIDATAPTGTRFYRVAAQ